MAPTPTPPAPGPGPSEPDTIARAYQSLCVDEPGGSLVRRLLQLARDEDMGTRGDVTSDATIDPHQTCDAQLIARQPGVAAGLALVDPLITVFKDSPTNADDRALLFLPQFHDGSRFEARCVLGTLTGSTRAVLAIERTLLNLLSRLCGIASRTDLFVQAIRGTGATLCDTRKTTPGLRVLEKYAVCCGGGSSHRTALHDAILVKDNHLAASTDDLLGLIDRAVACAARDRGIRFVQVEVDTLDQLDLVLTIPSGVDIVLLDNMTLDQLGEAVARRDRTRPDLLLEASGGITLDSIAAVAATGVDRISTGSITHGAVWLDLALDITHADPSEPASPR